MFPASPVPDLKILAHIKLTNSCTIKSITPIDLLEKKLTPTVPITKSAIESGSAIINACVFVITFSAVTEILPFGQYSILSGFLEVTRGCSESANLGYNSLALTSAFISWGGMSVHFQADALSGGEFNMKLYYIGKAFCALMAYAITKAVCADMSILLLVIIIIIGTALIAICLRNLFSKQLQKLVFRQRRHS